jgi:hypothetical protein
MNSAVKKILKEGLVISTLLESSYTWQQNVIQSINDELIYIPLLDYYLSELVLQGAGISIKCSGEYYEYIFDGIVADISIETPSFIAVKIHKVHEKINTRAFTRYDIYLPSNVKPVKEKASYFSIVTNISITGMAFSSNHDFVFGDDCSVTIRLPDNKIITATGKIKHKIPKDKLSDYGMHFMEISDTNSKILSDYILSLENGYSKLKTMFFDEKACSDT